MIFHLQNKVCDEFQFSFIIFHKHLEYLHSFEYSIYVDCMNIFQLQDCCTVV